MNPHLIAIPFLAAGAALAQPEILDIGEGTLTWTPGAAASYRVEWSHLPGGPYRTDWNELSLIPGGGGVHTNAIPMFFRLAEHAGGAALPAPVTETSFAPQPADKVELGRLLFFDKILSGNRNISCATCHHSLTGTGDGLALPIGEGGRGLGPTRDTGSGADAVPERVPRNAPAVFNLGAREFEVLFHDGRVAFDSNHPSGFATPAGDDLPQGLDSLLAAQAMFPVTSGTEMAGQGTENEISEAADNLPELWHRLALRLRAIPEYVDLFVAAFPDVGGADDITYVHAANAIGAFEAVFWRADNSPYDEFLRGRTDAMSPRQIRGMDLFYGKANCASCHSGPFQTDNDFHAICIPQIGPGKGDGPSGHDDFGREQVTGDPADRYKFRTPTLRNVALTAPYGHDGAYDTLEAVVRHHLSPLFGFIGYDPSQLTMPSRPDLDALDLVVLNDPDARVAMVQRLDIDPVDLTDDEVADLLAFLHALTDPRSLDLRADVPQRLPSGLPVVE